MTGVALNTFPNIFLIYNICQCLFIIYLIFSKGGLYVTENGIIFVRTALVSFNTVDLSRLFFFYLISNDVFFVHFSHEPFNQVI